MKRDPIKLAMKHYYDSVRIKKIKPIFFYRKCDVCEQEFKLETMYECSYHDDYFSTTNYYYGCSCCFKSKDEFIKHCYSDIILPKDAWNYEGQSCMPIIKKIRLATKSNSSDVLVDNNSKLTNTNDNLSLFVVEDGNYKIAVKANNCEEAKEKAIKWSSDKYSLRLQDIGVSVCDNNEVVE